jgi:hypothetical protein
MHLSDVAYNDYADQEQDDDWYDEGMGEDAAMPPQDVSPPAIIAPAPAAKYMVKKPQAPRAQADEPAPRYPKVNPYDDDESTLKVYKPEQYREAANPAQQAAIAIAMKKAHKKPKQADEAISRKDLLKQVGDKLNDPEFRKQPADPTKRWEKGDLYQGPGPDDYGYTGYQGHGMPRDTPKKKKGVAEDTGSWIVYDPETKQIRKRFKTHTAGKSYANTHGLGFASSEFYFDRVKDNKEVAETALNPRDPRGDYAAKRKALQDLGMNKDVDQAAVLQRRLDLDREAKAKGVTEVAPPGAKAERMVKHIKKSLSKDGRLSDKDKAIAYATTWKAHNDGKVEEAQTDYQKRRQRERDVDAGRPVKPLPKNPQTDYARKRAKDRKDMEMGEGLGDHERREFKRQELQHELGHERNNLQVTINGKLWKVFPGRGRADSVEERNYLRSMQSWAEKKSASSGKKWTVSLTGANPTVNELSTEKLAQYKKAAGADASAADKRGDIARGNRRFKGIVKATIKQGDNDAKKHQELDEISRRDFLKGAGATAGLAAMGGAKGQAYTPTGTSDDDWVEVNPGQSLRRGEYNRLYGNKQNSQPGNSQNSNSTDYPRLANLAVQKANQAISQFTSISIGERRPYFMNYIRENVYNQIMWYLTHTNGYNAEQVIDYATDASYKAADALPTGLGDFVGGGGARDNVATKVVQTFISTYASIMKQKYDEYANQVSQQQQQQKITGGFSKEEFDSVVEGLMLYAICKEEKADNSKVFKDVSAALNRVMKAYNNKDQINSLYPQIKKALEATKSAGVYEKDMNRSIRLAPQTIDKLNRIASGKEPEFKEGVEEGLMKEPTTRKEYLDQRDRLFRMMAVDSNPANKQIIKQALQDLEARYGNLKNAVKEESSTASEAVERAILNRIMVAHTDLLMQFGPDKVMQAAEEVAYNVGDVDEIGTSDVSAYVNQVKQILGA